MQIRLKNDIVKVSPVLDFNLQDTLECGQCFHFEKVSEQYYRIFAFGKVIQVQQIGDTLLIENSSDIEVKHIWMHYFDLYRDYGDIKNKLLKIDSIIQRAVEYKPGIYILQQEPFECLISFIISQNKQIPHIKAVIRNLSAAWGTKVHYQNKEYSVFPTLAQLKEASEEQIKESKAGFRAKYIVDACEKLSSGEIDLSKLFELPIDEARSQLLKIKGVGNKVADCVLLYGLGHHRAFPKDVWVKRVMEYFYFGGENTKMETIEAFAAEKFGELAGFAQQYLFYYARDLKIGK